jgi:ABC-2 type transport system ATP-binding protein
VEDLLRVTDVTQIRATGLSAAARDEIRAVLERHGSTDAEIGNPRTTLEDLFLDIIRDTQARPGRRARSTGSDETRGG